MGRARSNGSEKPFPELWPQPLKPPELEAFAIKFHETFDGAGAARSAGYDDPDQIWPELVATDMVKSRLRYFRASGGVERLDPLMAFDQMFKQAFASLDSLLVPDVVTGVPRVDWEGAAKRMPVLFDVEETTVNNGGILQRTTRMRKPASLASVRALILDSEKVEARIERAEGFMSRDMLLKFFFNSIQSSAPIVPDHIARERMKNAFRTVVSEEEVVPDEEEEIEP